MLAEEISKAQRLVRTDAYQMSIGEIVSMYESGEIKVNPDFQRLFRWTIGQKSRLIESLLLGIPIPSIFVFEKDDGSWELIDGLQRISTILEFMGKLLTPDVVSPSILEGTKYLPSLHNAVWEPSDKVDGVPLGEQKGIDKGYQLSIRRARIGVEILKRPSDDQTKYDLFQRLNAGGTQANAQELRNCVMLMVNTIFYEGVKESADDSSFRTVIALSEDQIEKQRHMEMAVRFLVHTFVPYDGKMDVEEYVDSGIVELATKGTISSPKDLVMRTFRLLDKVAGKDALRRFEGGSHVGKVGLVGLEGIAVGVAKNLKAILKLPKPEKFLETKIQKFWTNPKAGSFTSPGLRGTTRIQRTVPFGQTWFCP